MDHTIRTSPYRVLEHGVECCALIPTFGSADPLILVGPNDHPAAVSDNHTGPHMQRKRARRALLRHWNSQKSDRVEMQPGVRK
jgi:hypothetical protein